MKASIIVQNLKCGGCAKTITSKLSDLDQVSEVTVDVESAMVSFVYNDVNDALRIKDKLKSLGYPSIENKNRMTVKAISFVRCVTGKMSKS